MIDVKKIKNIYFIGIKGVGMAMLAQFLANQGYKVSGSDTSEKFMTDNVLAEHKIKVKEKFNAKNLPSNTDLFIYSSAFSRATNIEVDTALKTNKPVLLYAEALGLFSKNYYGIAVCGSHGKTTTTAWLAYVLYKAGLKPNALVGSVVPQFKGSVLSGKGKSLVFEADEYQNKLQYFFPQGILLNNIDFDHPDFFKKPEAYQKVFADFVKRLPIAGFLVFNNDDTQVRIVANKTKSPKLSYGLKNKSDYQAYALEIKNGKQYFKVKYKNKDLGEFIIRLIGTHNVLNALAVIASASQMGVKLPKIKSGLYHFKGTERRAQILGKYNGALIIDDYAHHPTEIKATLSGLRSLYPGNRIITVFHPHTFSRTKALFKDFAKSFALTDELIILDIYGSAREKQGGVSSSDLALEVIARNKNKSRAVLNISNLKEAETYLRTYLRKGDVVVLMGAGDVFRIGQNLIK